MRFIYLILVCFAAPVAALVAWIRGMRDPSRRERIRDRIGAPKLSLRGPVIWVHAASMGEVQAGAILVRRLLRDYPRHEIVMTTMTTTGAARVRALFSERVAHCYLPYDLPFAVRRFLGRIEPELAIILETEMWPNLLLACRQRRIPVVIASARISPRTAGRYRTFAELFRGALAETTVAAQTEADAERFRALGAARVQVAGNIKFDIDVTAATKETGAALCSAIGRRFVWVAGSTHEGEERAALDAHRRLLETEPQALMILAPRHPQRFDDVRTLLISDGIRFVARSSAQAIDPGVSVLFVDTMGELLACYAAADLAFVGGSLVPVGGHNVLEPAALDIPVLCGPHMSNAQDVFDRLSDAGALLQVRDGDALTREIVRLASDPSARKSLAANAATVLQENRGTIDRLMTVVAASIAR